MGTTLLVDGKQIVCKNRAMGTWGATRGIQCWKPTSFASEMRKGKTKREDGNQFQRKLNRVNMQFSQWMENKKGRNGKGGQKNRKNKNRNKYCRWWNKKKKRRNIISKIFHFHMRDHCDKKRCLDVEIIHFHYIGWGVLPFFGICKNGQIWRKICIFGHFGPNIGIFGPFGPMPDQT